MEEQAGKQEKRRMLLVTAIPLVMTALLAGVFYGALRGLSVQQIVTYLPQNPFLAALSLWGMYALKSLSVFFPVTLLFMSAGVMFSPPVAVLVSAVGVAVEFLLPYLLGRYTGNMLERAVFGRFPKLRRVEDFRTGNRFLFAFLLRVLGFLPCDAVSWYLGSTGMPAPVYFAGSLCGMLPGAVLQTLLGTELAGGFSWKMAALCGAMVAIALVTMRYGARRHKG